MGQDNNHNLLCGIPALGVVVALALDPAHHRHKDRLYLRTFNALLVRSYCTHILVPVSISEI